MPTRSIPLVTGEIYHLVNRGVFHQTIFSDVWEYTRFLEAATFYQYSKTPIRYSNFKNLCADEKQKMWLKIKTENKKLITFLTFSVMPNHYHFIIRQEEENGISKFCANLQNSYGKYFNEKHRRTGHVWEGQFRAKRIETEEQLLHTHRYTHLNPFTSYIVKTTNELLSYKYSSLPQYLEAYEEGLCDTKRILSNFKSKEAYLEFILDQKDYQRTLERIKHLLLE